MHYGFQRPRLFLGRENIGYCVDAVKQCGVATIGMFMYYVILSFSLTSSFFPAPTTSPPHTHLPPAEIDIGCGDVMGRTGVQSKMTGVSSKNVLFIFLISYVNRLSMHNASMMRLAAPSHPICLDMYRYPRNILMEPFPS